MTHLGDLKVRGDRRVMALFGCMKKGKRRQHCPKQSLIAKTGDGAMNSDVFLDINPKMIEQIAPSDKANKLALPNTYVIREQAFLL